MQREELELSLKAWAASYRVHIFCSHFWAVSRLWSNLASLGSRKIQQHLRIPPESLYSTGLVPFHMEDEKLQTTGKHSSTWTSVVEHRMFWPSQPMTLKAWRGNCFTGRVGSSQEESYIIHTYIYIYYIYIIFIIYYIICYIYIILYYIILYYIILYYIILYYIIYIYIIFIILYI